MTTSQPAILRLVVVLARTGLARSTLYSLIATGDFPRQVKLSKRAVGWRESDVNHWLSSRIPAA